MSVLTVFFCGTGSNSEDNNHKNYVSGELISTLAKNTTGRGMIDYIQWMELAVGIKTNG
ncbi:hypothetical protein [Vibrio crassostreae]|uniref:hypothetical protein n=1 Tax=Vibrio crassostreae TaxID=246167 RepID=UPI001FEE6E74|nr:hypothetical protein [Vibrio crassostreae]